uniref:Cation/H(+) antiporter 15-like n=1 Tax=Cucumis melo TaxID=3656 RepID=A0A9I9D977_CUCME
MGSIVMEPNDIATYINGGIGHRPTKNFTTICTFANHIHCTSIFIGANPLEFSVPLLFLQLGICSGTIILFSQLLKPLGQPLIVSQILGGLVLGSTGLSNVEIFKETIFPLRGFVSLDVVSALGHIFYYFLIGVQTDISIVKNIDMKTFGIGSCATILATLLVIIYSMSLASIIDMTKFKYIFELGKLESFINFPMVASLVYELHLVNSEFGRISLTSSMASSLLSVSLTLLGSILSPNGTTRQQILSETFAIMTRHSMDGKDESDRTTIEGVFCDYIAFGGVGPPIGSTLVDRLDFITTWIFMPVFFARIGLSVDIYNTKLINFICMSFIVIVSALGKFLGALMISMYYKLPMRDAISLGLILNSQGALELMTFRMKKRDKVIDDDAFVVGCLYITVMVAIITPAIRYLLHPSRRYIVKKRRTVMHTRPEHDLCVLVCIHDQEDVPSAINLLDALNNPMKQSQLVVYMLHLVELLGHAQPKLIHHRFTKVKTSRSYSSEPIVNAFKYFGDSNNEIVVINPFTAISPFTTMHDDVCSLALDKKSFLIFVPFHKRFHSNGVMSSSKYKLKMVNDNILENAPCSVALVVERGFLKLSKSIETCLYSFQIAVVFIGGADDREAMFIGARMAGHANINLTMIRVLESEKVGSDEAEESRVDDEAVDEFRRMTVDNYRVRYIEEVVKDGIGTICILRSMGSNFDLVMVGRRHSPCSALVQGLVLWNEHTELGAIGEVLATSDFMGNAMILVIQQHTRVANENHDNAQETIL